MPVQTLRWADSRLFILDQTLLPGECREIELARLADVWEAIKALRIRGAPAIGICAALGVLVSLRESNPANLDTARQTALAAADHLATSRPTAVNLFWALDRMRRVANAATASDPKEFFTALEQEARSILDDDKRICRAIGAHGAPLIEEGTGILTHCNAGGLATAGYGTALAALFTAHEQGRRFSAYAGETRPLLQGARLTAWELVNAGIDVTLLCDNMVAQVMREGRINLVIVGADRIAANGDTANKIGTYGVALLAKAHGIPFYVAAPSSTFDLSLADGSGIPIEQRDPGEVTCGFGRRTAPEGVRVYNPAFDVTPAELISGIVSEHGILRAPYVDSIMGRV